MTTAHAIDLIRAAAREIPQSEPGPLLALSTALEAIRALHLTPCAGCGAEVPAASMVNLLGGLPYDDEREPEPVQMVCRACADVPERMRERHLRVVPCAD